jgi:hypothetical protein
MTVAELIEALRAMPQDAPVGYVNQCADDGNYWVPIDCAENQGRGNWMRAPTNMPAKCVVLE